jgi:methyl-accepting chemotaxis protein
MTMDTIDEIAKSSAVQAEGVAAVQQVMEQLKDMTHRNASLVDKVAQASESMRERAVQLIDQVATFKLKDTDSPRLQGTTHS